jgi:hypothetical protein
LDLGTTARDRGPSSSRERVRREAGERGRGDRDERDRDRRA